VRDVDREEGRTVTAEPLETAARVEIRRARAGDAVQLVALFEEAYRGKRGRDARQLYPFPQFLDPDRVAALVEDEAVCWLVAQEGGRIVGTFGALSNVGTDRDGVAETFGLVVHQSHRGRRIGRSLVEELTSALRVSARVLLAETRTADPRGWRSVRSVGFQPIGYEPEAHRTPAGMEAMLLTARLGRTALAGRVVKAVTAPVIELANAVLAPLALETPPAAPAAPGLDVAALVVKRVSAPTFDPLFERIGGARHAAGVVSLDRLEGEDKSHRRYDRRLYLGRSGREVVAACRALLDRNDRRARLLALRAGDERLAAGIVDGVVDDLARIARGGPRTIVIDVLADAHVLQRELHRLGFFPTCYYPALVARGAERIDAIQFTRLVGHAAPPPPRLDWDAAQGVIDAAYGTRVERP
jgi:GNAT superfamily N-acetyltransferase